MKQEFEDYLRGLGMGDVLVARVEETATMVHAWVAGPLDHIFVSDGWTPEGQRQYESLFLLSKDLVVEARQFVITNDFEVDAIRADVHNLKVTVKDFDFTTTTDASRVNVRYSTRSGLAAEFRASQANCVHLQEVIKSCILPNLRGGD